MHIIPFTHKKMTTDELDERSKALVEDILLLYQCKPTEKCYSHFASTVEFEDPLEHAKGANSVRSSFNSLSGLFCKSDTLWWRVESSSDSLLKLVVMQKWEIAGIHKTVDKEHHLDIHLNEEQKIIKIEDRWEGKPLPNSAEGGKMGSLLEVRVVVAQRHIHSG